MDRTRRLLLAWLLFEGVALGLFVVARHAWSHWSPVHPPVAGVVALAACATWAAAIGATHLADHGLGRLGRLSTAELDGVLRELAEQPDPAAVAGVLVRYLRGVAHAEGVVLTLLGQAAPLAADPPGAQGAQPVVLPLGVHDVDLGHVALHGAHVRGGDHLRRVLHYGALALRNAMLAADAADAELASTQARVQRDLQARLTFAVSEQIYDRLGEVRGQLLGVREHLGAIRRSQLAAQLGEVAGELAVLEHLIQDNLRRVAPSREPLP